MRKFIASLFVGLILVVGSGTVAEAATAPSSPFEAQYGRA
jgi:hypothetical protein